MRQSAWTVAAVVLLAYGWWLFVFFHTGHDAREFAAVERSVAHRSGASSVIRFDRRFPYASAGRGYDGQYYYFIALDPARARYYVDDPSYRYTKILYPLTARLLALGRADLIPYTLILVNWLALSLGTLAIAAWLRRKRVSPWFALICSFYPGLFFAFQRDLTEPLSYALIALAVYLFDFGGRRRILWSGVAFALAVLARDKAAVWAGMYALALLASREGWEPSRGLVRNLLGNVGKTCLLLGVAGGPMLLYKIFLHYWLGSVGIPPEAAAPLQGVFSSSVPLGTRIVKATSVYLPAIICTALAAWALWKRLWKVQVFLLLVQVDLSIVTLHPVYFLDPFGLLRVGTAIVLAAIYCIPVFDQLTGRNRSWLLLSSSCWLWLSASWLALGLALLVG